MSPHSAKNIKTTSSVKVQSCNNAKSITKVKDVKVKDVKVKDVKVKVEDVKNVKGIKIHPQIQPQIQPLIQPKTSSNMFYAGTKENGNKIMTKSIIIIGKSPSKSITNTKTKTNPNPNPNPNPKDSKIKFKTKTTQIKTIHTTQIKKEQTRTILTQPSSIVTSSSTNYSKCVNTNGTNGTNETNAITRAFIRFEMIKSIDEMIIRLNKEFAQIKIATIYDYKSTNDKISKIVKLVNNYYLVANDLYIITQNAKFATELNSVKMHNCKLDFFQAYSNALFTSEKIQEVSHFAASIIAYKALKMSEILQEIMKKKYFIIFII